MNIKRSIGKKINRIFGVESVVKNTQFVKNFYQTNHPKKVLISYIAHPFLIENNFSHQSYVTAHIVAQNFSDLGFNVDIIDHFNQDIVVNYDEYACLFGFGYVFEQSFYALIKPIHRILFVTGAHEEFQNSMSLKSVKDFFKLSNIWLANEANVIKSNTYYAMREADAVIILAKGFIYDDFKSRYKGRIFSLNNNILEAFANFETKTIASRSRDLLFLSGAKQLTKGLHFLIEVAKTRKDLNFHIVLPVIDPILEDYYHDTLFKSENVFFYKNIRMDSEQMKEIIEKCSYVIAPSYTDGLPGGTLEPMSAGLIPIISRYCGFESRGFIIEMDEPSVENLNLGIDKALNLTDEEYLRYSTEVKTYTCTNFSRHAVNESLAKILADEVNLINI